MAQCNYTTKYVLSMLDEDSEDDFEGYIDEEKYADTVVEILGGQGGGRLPPPTLSLGRAQHPPTFTLLREALFYIRRVIATPIPKHFSKVEAILLCN